MAQPLDFGSQYRSAIFYHDAGQQKAAIASRDTEQQSRRRQIVTPITTASTFYRAEEYHQRYFEKHGHLACAPPSGKRAPQAGAAAAVVSHLRELPQAPRSAERAGGYRTRRGSPSGRSPGGLLAIQPPRVMQAGEYSAEESGHRRGDS